MASRHFHATHEAEYFNSSIRAARSLREDLRLRESGRNTVNDPSTLCPGRMPQELKIEPVSAEDKPVSRSRETGILKIEKL